MLCAVVKDYGEVAGSPNRGFRKDFLAEVTHLLLIYQEIHL